jgi:enoyl-CoA hydratase/carnithine racemase
MQFADYATRYNTIRFERTGGVLELIMHSRGGEARWGSSPNSLHAELGNAFLDIARDPENKVIILTGTGHSFVASMDGQERQPEPTLLEMWDRIYDEGVSLLENLLAIPVPVIGAVNGPAYIHAELAVLSDIVLAAEHAEFADLAHAPGNCVPGDGVHTIWPMLLGPNRGRYFLLTGQKLNARQALELGVVSEVLPAAALMPRARQLANQLAALPRRQLRHTRAVLVRHLRRRLREDLDFGLAVEALAMV